MKKLIGMLVILGIAAVVNAAPAMGDNFESYADSNALRAAWVVHTGGVPITETLEVSGDNQYMKMAIVGAAPWWAQTKYTLPGAEMGVHGVNWTSTGLGYTTFTFDYKITDKASDRTQVGFYDCWGQYVGGADVGNGNVHDWETVVLNLATVQKAGMNYENVAIIGFTIKNTYNGAGDLLIDNVVIPEPATVALLSLGGLLLRRRK